MSLRKTRPFPFARTVVSLTALAMFGAFTAEALMPDSRASYAIVNAAAIAQKPTTVGIGDSDLYFSTEAQINERLDAMAALGVTNVRVLIPWYDVNPDPGVYDWSKIDRVVAAANARNMGVLATITHSPDWAVTPGDTPVISPPAKVADYGDFTALVAQRYKGKISAYEIWNEANGAVAFHPAPDAARYTALLKDAYVKIKAIDPSVTVIAGVLGAVPTIPGESVNSPTFLSEMYTAGAKDYFDAISFHPYQFSTPYSQGPDLNGSPINEVRDMRALMVSQGDAAKLIWASEYGLPTSQVSEAQQAAYIADFLAAWSAQGYAGPMFIYTTRDKTGTYESDLDFGIYRADGTAKPAAKVIADFIAAHPQAAKNPNLVQLIIGAVNQFAQRVVLTVTQFVQTVIRAISSAFTPKVTAPTTVTKMSIANTPTPLMPTTSTTTASTPTTTRSTTPTTTGTTTSTTSTTTSVPTSTTSGSSTTSTTTAPSTTAPASTAGSKDSGSASDSATSDQVPSVAAVN